RAVVVGQLGQRLVDLLADLAARGLLGGVAAQELGEQLPRSGRRLLLQVRERVVIVHLLLARLLAFVIDCDVHDDPIQPGIDARVPRKAGWVPERLEDRPLPHIERRVAVAPDPERGGVGPPLVPLEHQSERVPVARLAAVDERCIRVVIVMLPDRRAFPRVIQKCPPPLDRRGGAFFFSTLSPDICAIVARASSMRHVLSSRWMAFSRYGNASGSLTFLILATTSRRSAQVGSSWRSRASIGTHGTLSLWPSATSRSNPLCRSPGVPPSAARFTSRATSSIGSAARMSGADFEPPPIASARTRTPTAAAAPTHHHRKRRGKRARVANDLVVTLLTKGSKALRNSYAEA